MDCIDVGMTQKTTECLFLSLEMGTIEFWLPGYQPSPATSYIAQKYLRKKEVKGLDIY